MLTREGWLQPWVRTAEDRRRRAPAAGRDDAVPDAQPRRRHQAGGRGPCRGDATLPARPRRRSWPSSSARATSAALLIGDLWRWGMRRENPDRERPRSLVASNRPLAGRRRARSRRGLRASQGRNRRLRPSNLAVRVRDAEYRPLDNAKVAFRVTLPGGDNLTLDAEPDGREAGTYAATYVPKQPGAYRVVATATAPDGSTVGEREAGWAAQPAADEFARLEPDREFLKTIASKTQGEVVDGDSLASFVASLSSRERPDHRALDLPVVASTPLFPDRHRLPGGRMGPAPRQRPGMNRSMSSDELRIDRTRSRTQRSYVDRR